MHPHRHHLPILVEADARVEAFQAATGLSCPPGCGVCCERHDPHVTEHDLAPLAFELVAEDLERAAGLRERAVAALAAGAPCVFYEAGRIPGGCTQYARRPLLCRLFGFAAVRDKHGQPELAACHVHQEVTPEAVARARAHVDGGGAVPVFTDLQAPLDALDPARAQTRVPINAAIVAALDRALLRASWGAG